MMMYSTVLNGALGLAAVITICFITTDIDRQIVNGDPNYPFVEIFAEALDSVGGAVTLAAGTIVICISKTTNASSRYETQNADRYRHDDQRDCRIISPKLGLRS
jgi:hypothetical protein